MSELSDKISGKTKQAAGQITDDTQLQNEGKLEEARGTVKEKLNNAADAVSDKLNEAKQTFDK